MDRADQGLPRRGFLASLAGVFAASGSIRETAAAPETVLHILGPGNIERLRADFNTHRASVRLLAILSPT